MTQSDSLNAAVENLQHTYFHLGEACAASQRIEEPGFLARVSTLDHPLVNFAFASGLDPWSARRLAELANCREHFFVYCVPELDLDNQAEVLHRSGFVEVLQLSIMVSAPPLGSVEIGDSKLQSAEVTARRQVAEFMVSQFFLRQTRAYREGVQAATERASALPLFTQSERGRIVAAVMLSESERAVGIYNLCVRSDHRGAGLGSRLLRECQYKAFQQGKLAILQCEAKLQHWYASEGFEKVGKVQVFAAQDDSKVAIMESFASENLA